jgi:hypothetical protein
MNKLLAYLIIKLMKRNKLSKPTEKRYKFLADLTSNTNTG